MNVITTKQAELEKIAQGLFKDARLVSFAPFLMGLWLDALGLGLIVALFFRWQMMASGNDKPLTRLLVYYLLLVNVGTSCFALAHAVFLFVSGFGDYRVFLDTIYPRIAFTLCAISRLPAAAFFVHRVYALYNKNTLIPIVLAPLLLASAASAFAVTATLDQYPVPLLSRQLIWVMGSTDLAADIIITVMLANALVVRKIGWVQTDDTITRLLSLTAETQLPPTLIAIAYVVVTAVRGQSTYLAYFQGAAKVHVVCLLIVVTSRVDTNGSSTTSMVRKRMSKMQQGESIELGSTDTVRVDTVTHIHSEPLDDFYQKRSSKNRDGDGDGDDDSLPPSLASEIKYNHNNDTANDYSSPRRGW